MSEDFEEQPSSSSFDIGRVLDVVRRRHVQFLIPLFLGWLVVWGCSWFLPARYKSGTLILVEEPTMPKNYVVPNVNDDLQGRLQSISQQILSRTRLLMIINNLNLYNGKHEKGLSPDEKVDLMRKDIDIELVRAHDDSISAFRIHYAAPSAHVAQDVTSKLTNLFIDENLKVRQQQSEDTTNFIQSQLETARTELNQQEAKIRDFQATHQGELPTQQTTNLQILSGLQAQFQSEQEALTTAKQQRIYSQSLIDQYHSLRTPQGSPTGLPALDQQLITMKSQLADLSTRYTENHPDVVRLKREIVKTERERENLIAAINNAPKGADAAAAAPEIVDPTQNSPLLQLQSQLHATQIEITNREQAIRVLSDRIADYQRRLNGGPASEQQLNELSRGYEQSKANYDELQKKGNESRMATSMEQLQQGERFTMLDPPSLPLKPDSPNRFVLCGVGLVFGLILGALTVSGLEFFDDRIHSDKEIKSLLPVAVLSEVPVVSTAEDEYRFRRRAFLGWAMTAAVAICILAGSAFSYLHS
jgi:polysaccharide chain length determinant protein (PEP-CTERM system associated)